MGDQVGSFQLFRKAFGLVLIAFLIGGKAFSQQPPGLFIPVQADSSLITDPDWLPNTSLLFRIDTAALKTYLNRAPWEWETNPNPFTLTIPLSDGSYTSFQVVKTALLSPSLQAEYPAISTYKGWGLTDPLYRIRLDLTPSGFHVQVLGGIKSIYGDPPVAGRGDMLRMYFPENIPGGFPSNPFTCLVPDSSVSSGKIFSSYTPRTTGDIRIYRLAVAATGEFTQFHGGTVVAGLSAIVTTINRVTGIYEKEMGIGFQLIGSTQNLIFTDPANDPFTNTDVFALASESQIWLDAYVGNANYDIGHVFCTAGGGLAAYDAVCQSGLKAKGISGRVNPIGDAFDVDIVSHEIGHQFGAHHTQNNSCGRNAPTAFEPASGSTIMAYAGFCPPNLQPNSDDYFHLANLIEIKGSAVNGPASSCPFIQNAGNQLPVVHVDTTSYVLPKSTPFELKGSATDPNGDLLSYCWEQYDLGPGGSPWNPQGYAPLFRSYPPQLVGNRYFPSIPVLLAGTPVLGELLPNTSRPLNFRLTVRDNRLLGSEYAFAGVSLVSTDLAGPFELTCLNAPTVLNGGMPQRITWKVASTNQPPVNCKWVHILLSRDGGLTWPDTLARRISNNGSAWVAMPNVAASACRVMVKAADHIFFQINTSSFSIQPTSAPGFVLFGEADMVEACAPGSVTLPIVSLPIGGFNQMVSYYVVGLPSGVQATFVPAQAVPGDTILLILDSLGQANPGNYSMQVVGGTTNGSNFSLPISLHILEGIPRCPVLIDLPGPNEFLPRNPVFRWNAVAGATGYRLELSRNPGFNSSSFVRTVVLTDTLWEANPQLDPGGIYYWRVQSMNVCGTGHFSAVQALHVRPLVCRTYASTNVPVIIPYYGTSVNSSYLSITDSLTISTLFVKGLVGTHSWISDLRARMIGPDSTYSVLFSHICADEQDFNLGFSDQTVNQIVPCPPTTGLSYRPQTPLSNFNGKNAAGNWTLEITDDVNLDGGQLNGWGLEICAEDVPSINPWVVHNHPLDVSAGNVSALSAAKLEVTDGLTAASDLTFTLLYCPTSGRMLNHNAQLYTGNTFRQQDILSGQLSFEANANFQVQDSFVFVVTTPSGGWLGNTTFTFRNSATTSLEPLQGKAISIFPNPANRRVTVRCEQCALPPTLTLVDLAGRQVAACETNGENMWEWMLPELPAGIYHVLGNSQEGLFSQPLIINHD